MDRYVIENIFGIDNLNLTWYGLIIGCGILLGSAIVMRKLKQMGYKYDLFYDFIIFALPVSIICARLYYVIFEWSYYQRHPIEIIAVWHGGLAIYGGVIGGVLTAVVFSKIKKFPFLRILDLFAPSLILGQAIGRWGNFVNQEAYGNLITKASLQFFPYGVYIDQLNQWYQATFFYESMWDLLVFTVLMFYSKKAEYNGDIFARYLIGYGIGRFFIEGLRSDSLYLLGTIRISQVLSLVLIAVGIVMIVLQKRSILKPIEYEGAYKIKSESK